MIRPECFLTFSKGWKRPTGEEIRELLFRAGLTNVQVSKLVGLSHPFQVSQWKVGKVAISYASWVILCEAANREIPIENDLKLFKAKKRQPKSEVRPECFLPFSQGWKRPTGEEIREIIFRTGLKDIQANKFIGCHSKSAIYTLKIEKYKIKYATWIILCRASGIKITLPKKIVIDI